ncbi:MAG: hypothetical protein AAGB00_06370 [Planctomycetota bacterium]
MPAAPPSPDGACSDLARRGAARRRWAVYSLLIAIATGQMAGRLLAVNSVDLVRLEQQRVSQRLESFRSELTEAGVPAEEVEQRVESRRVELQEKLRLQRPFLSGNDRSRWLAIRALVEHGTYEIDRVLEEPTWDTIDMVKHPNRDGAPRLYSSKPPLLVTLLAGKYWLIYKLTGCTLGTHPYTIGRAMLVTTNLLPMALMMVLVAAVAERLFDRIEGGSTNDDKWLASDWPRMFVVASAAFGTLLTPFAVVLNNHLVGAVSASIALYAWARVRLDGDRRGRWFALAGAAAAFTAANELPALALLVFLGVLLMRAPRQTVLCFVPAALVVVAAFFATNYAAHNSLRPPYMHRSGTEPSDNWYDYTYTRAGRERDSYWNQRRGMDVGEPSRAKYALHALVGHHGVFSLTPIWLLSFAGAAYSLARGNAVERELAGLILSLSVVCFTFYIGLRGQMDRNYGGMTAGFRWMFWFAPLWLAAMAPAVAWLAKTRAGRTLAGVLLALSALSTAYPTWNPWRQPWLYDWFEALGWV